MNDQWTKYTGRSAADALTYQWADLLHPDDRTPTTDAWSATVTAGTVFETEYRLLRSDGEYRWHLSRAIPIKSSAGVVSGWIGTSTDIHDRKIMEAKLRLSEERLRLAQAAASIVAWDLDLVEDRYSHIPEFFDQFEFEPGAAVGFQDWLNRIHPEDRDRIQQIMQNPSQYTNGLEVEFRLVRRDGSVRWILGKGSTIADSHGRVIRATGINVDITSWKQAEAEIREGRERLRFALNAAQMGIWEWDVWTNVITCSDDVAALFGQTPSPNCLTLESFLHCVYPADRPGVLREMRAAVDRDVSYSREFRVLSPDGEVRWIELQGAPTKTRAVQGVRMIGIARDITEKKTLEQKLAAAEKFESIGVMAAGLAHDFNNLLVSVIGSASLAQEILTPEHEASSLLSDVVSAGERAALLTSQMLAYSGKGQLRKAPVNMTQAVQEAMLAVEPRIPSGTEVVLDLEPNLMTAGDENRIRHVLVNLLTNAAESLVESPGRITVRTRLHDIDQPYLDRVLRSDNVSPGLFIVVDVVDTGHGIADKIRDKIFEPFFSTRFTGRGLGLAAADGIVRAHRGAIHLTKNEGLGTTFSVLLPSVETQQVPRARYTTPGRQAGFPTVLVVDDEEVVAKTVETSLQKRGYRVITAANGAAALDIIRKTDCEISVVLLDLTMPGLSAKDVLRRIRETHRTLPVILSSGYSEEDALSHIESDRIDAFLQKPYTAKVLLQSVHDCLTRASAARKQDTQRQDA